MPDERGKNVWNFVDSRRHKPDRHHQRHYRCCGFSHRRSSWTVDAGLYGHDHSHQPDGFSLSVSCRYAGIIVGSLCVLIFIPTALARYRFHLAGIWRPVFIIGAMVLLFFNCLVLIIQSFQKIPVLNALAPNGNEPPILAAQVALLVACMLVGYFSIRRFRPTLLGV
ncbi:hypothetical protein [Rhizobium sp. P44RR-XXIV]|uniref:hypothetical protein n=1 Tax=Rhizobium sp. P44RR-XXIV TaxID=1921145 RepID=UPI001FEF1B2A|nr:hypothetical protein [Rhizobium sp. P44RR-XXIV]